MKIVMDKEELMDILKTYAFTSYGHVLGVEFPKDIELVESYNIQWGDYTFRKIEKTKAIDEREGV